MDVSEDGYVTGSVDVAQLDEIKPKSDEAKEQLEALKARRDEGQAQAEADAEKLAETAKAQDQTVKEEKKPEPVKAPEAKPAEKKG